ncbi:MAG: glycoside hydrolase [Kiritimatiellae bacterium]|nr:glycoside hydrolase [Kiritimatiellia bacterium]
MVKIVWALGCFSVFAAFGAAAPRVVGVPPCYAVRDMCRTADGEIRHYGRRETNGRAQRVYVASRDGENWTVHVADPRDPGAMVQSPWSGDWICFTGMDPVTLVRSKKGPGDVAAERVAMPWKSLELRQLIPLRSRKRWVAAFSDVLCDAERGGRYHSTVCWSDDDGRTWKRVDLAPVPGVPRLSPGDKRPHWFSDGCEPSVAELADGTLKLVVRTSGEHAAFYESRDGGETWSEGRPDPAFWQANTMPYFFRLRDGRLLFIWNNTAMLPTLGLENYPELGEGERSGQWETVFTNRDALHAAISDDDGNTWRGFRELILNPVRNASDFRELGAGAGEEHDKSVHQTQALELDDGTVLLACGQNAAARRFVKFDPDWLLETARREDFSRGLEAISHHLFVKSLSGGWRGRDMGHCAWERVPGALLVREPETGRGTNRQCLQVCRIRDPRLVSDRQGAAWNFPAARRGRVELECRVDGAGFRLSLSDHWFNPCDETSPGRSPFTRAFTAADLPAGQWHRLAVEWDEDAGVGFVAVDGVHVASQELAGRPKFGLSYLHLQALADGHDPQGAYFRSFDMTALPRFAPSVTVVDAATGARADDVKASLAGVAADTWSVALASSTTNDRALAVRVAWPVAGKGGITWWTSPCAAETLAAGAGERYAGDAVEAGRGTLAKWPLAVAETVDGGAFALAFDPWFPAVARFGCDPAARTAFADFDVALTREAPKAELRVARFAAPRGFRGAMADWRRRHADLFRVRVEKWGVWMPFARISEVAGWEDFSFAYKEGDNEPDWDDAHGVYTFHYTEPCTYWMDVAGPTNSYTLADCARMAEKRCAELRAMKAVPQDRGSRLAAAWADAVIHDAAGKPVGSIHDVPWCRGAVWCYNSAPDQPGPWRAWDAHFPPEAFRRRHAKPFPAGVDGEYVDSAELYVTVPLDFNRAHFAGMKTPLTWEPKTKRPAVFKGMIAYEYVRRVAERVHARGRLSMANGTPLKWWFLAPWLDVLGSETDWCDWRGGKRAWTPPSAEEFLLWRGMAGRKPFCFLMNTDFSVLGDDGVRKYFERSIAYGCFPGFFSADAATSQYFKNPSLYNRDRPLFKKYMPIAKSLAEAGWRDVNQVLSADDPAIACEQFGARGGKCFATVFNPASEARAVVLRRKDGGLGPTRELVTGGEWAWTPERTGPAAEATVRIVLPPETLRVVAFGKFEEKGE